MRSTMGRLNLATAAARLAAASPSAEQEAPAPTWIVPSPDTTAATASDTASVRRRATAADPLGGNPIPQETATLLRQARGSGAPLSAPVARTAGEALGTDLGSVRVHTDARADGLTRSMQAVAFSYGPDMYFSAGTYRPHSAAGSHLLAHELSHVAEGPGGGSGPVIGRADDPAEARADAAATRLAPALRRSAADPQAGGAVGRSGIAQGGVISGDVRRAVLRRKITSLNKKSTDIEAANGSAVVKKERSFRRTVTGSKNSLYKLGLLLDQLQKKPADQTTPDGQTTPADQTTLDDQTTLFYLGAIVVMCEHWLDRHEGADNPKLTELIEDIYAEARRDRGNALAQQRYVDDLQQGETSKQAPKSGFRRAKKTKPTPFTQQIGAELSSKAANQMALAQQGSANLKAVTQKRVADLINTCGLTQAEVAAIITYTASDYLYINPATAGNDAWLTGQQPAIAKASQAKGHGTAHLDPKQMKSQGVTHAGVLMQAMAKLPVQQGPVYRGARMNQKEFDETYGRRRQIVYPAFTSTSTRLSTCTIYANGGSERGPAADQDISVKAFLTVTNARDVQMLSDAGGESEWLLLPGATFTVTKIEDDPVQTPGVKPYATQWKIVHMQQVDNGVQAPMLPTTQAPQLPGKPSPSRQAPPLPSKPSPQIGPSPLLSTAASRALLKLAAGNFSA